VTARLERWRLAPGGDGYRAPEIAGSLLVGTVTGHPVKADGTRVTTGHVVEFTADRARTARTEYELGALDPEFAALLRERAAAGQRTVLGVPIEALLAKAPS
jgi:hypothetical protein